MTDPAFICFAALLSILAIPIFVLREKLALRVIVVVAGSLTCAGVIMPWTVARVIQFASPPEIGGLGPSTKSWGGTEAGHWGWYVMACGGAAGAFGWWALAGSRRASLLACISMTVATALVVVDLGGMRDGVVEGLGWLSAGFGVYFTLYAGIVGMIASGAAYWATRPSEP